VSILGPKTAPKGDQNVNNFGTLFLQLSGVRRLRKWELNENDEKAIGAGNIFSKGRDKALKGPLRPLLHCTLLIS